MPSRHNVTDAVNRILAAHPAFGPSALQASTGTTGTAHGSAISLNASARSVRGAAARLEMSGCFGESGRCLRYASGLQASGC